MRKISIPLALLTFVLIAYSQNRERYDALHKYFSTKDVDYTGLIASLIFVAVAIAVIIIYQHNQHMKQLKKHHQDISNFHKEIIGHLSKNDKD